MTDYVMLTPEDHKDILVDTARTKDLGDNVNFAMTFPFEFRNIQAHYPIFFQKNSDTGAFFPVALFGFQANENLFLNDDGWNASYVPAMIRRQPFLIGFQASQTDNEAKNAVVTIDMDNPRVNKDNGEPLFLEHGGSSEYLQEVTETLELIHQAHEHSEKFVTALTEHELLEQFTLNVDLEDGSANQMLGFYTINEEKLQQLSPEILGRLNEQGFLMPTYMTLASHSCIRTLIDHKNQSSKV
jgi:hypothetical protein